MNKRVMILGGGENQLPLIKEAKRAGYYVVLCDYIPDCVGKKYCDIHYVISTYEVEALFEVAKKENVSGIVTNSEPVLHVVSELTKRLGLPTVPLEVTERFRNKDKMRDWLTPLKLSDVAYKLCDNVEEAIAFYVSLNGKKAIMKPQDSSSSRGVFSINSIEDIRTYFEDTIKENRRQHSVLVEEYITGTEFTVDGICINGKHTTLAISEKKHFSYNENVANELFFSYENKDFDYTELRNLNNRIVEAAGLNFGLTHAEYKYDGKFHLIEVAARGGGVFISTDIVPYLTKMETVRMYIDCACGVCNVETLAIPEESKTRVAVLKFFATPNQASGYVERIEGEVFLASHPNIIMYGLQFKVGDYIQPAEIDAKRVGYYIACSESENDLKNIMIEVENNFKIVLKE